MPLVAARRKRVMPRLEFVVGLLHIGMHLVEVGLCVLHILMQSVVTLLTALDRAVNRILYILAVLLVVLPGLLVVLAERIGVLVRVLMQLLGVLLGGIDVRLDLLVGFAHMLYGPLMVVLPANPSVDGATSLAEAAEGKAAMPMVNIPAAAAAAIRFLMVVPLLRTFAFDL